MKRLWVTIIVLLLVLVPLLAGCAQQPTPAPAPPATTPPPARTPGATPTATTATPAPSPARTATPADKFTPWGPMDQIEAAAKKEGKLTVYIGPGHGTPATQQAWSKLFQEKYGIAIEWVSASAAATIPRILTEQQTKNYVADVLLNGYGSVSDALVPPGHVQPILAPASLEKDVWRVNPDMLSPKDRLWLYLFIPVNPALVINTNLVKPGEEPQYYQDLLDPKWKGMITMTTPGKGGPGSGWFRSNYRVLGLDYMRKLAQQMVLQSTTGQESQAVARGQFALAVGPDLSTSRSLIEKGTPIKYGHLKEGDYAPAQGVYLVSNAPHPNAAKLLINWIYTQEGQTFFSKSEQMASLRKDVSQDWVYPDLRFDPARPLLLTSPEDAVVGRGDQLIGLGRQIFEELK